MRVRIRDRVWVKVVPNNPYFCIYHPHPIRVRVRVRVRARVRVRG